MMVVHVALEHNSIHRSMVAAPLFGLTGNAVHAEQHSTAVATSRH